MFKNKKKQTKHIVDKIEKTFHIGFGAYKFEIDGTTYKTSNNTMWLYNDDIVSFHIVENDKNNSTIGIKKINSVLAILKERFK